MQDPNQKPKMSPFQEAMLKFEQAMRESMEVEQARQREQASRMAQQRPMSSARQPGQQPRQRPAGPFATSAAPARAQAPQRQPMAPRIVESADLYAAQEGASSEGMPYPGIDNQFATQTNPVATRESTSHMAKQSAAYNETSRAIDSFQGHNAAANAADAAYGTIVPLAQTASPLMQGIIWAEVLGKPVSKRKGRGRHGF